MPEPLPSRFGALPKRARGHGRDAAILNRREPLRRLRRDGNRGVRSNAAADRSGLGPIFQGRR
jgi:hypothetical protein